jgi:hypothetical protein
MEAGMVISLVLAALLSGGGQTETSLRQTLNETDTALLAQIALPNVAGIVRHDVRPALPMDPPPPPPGIVSPLSVRFYTMAVSAEPGVYRREVFHVAMSRAPDGAIISTEKPYETAQIRLDSDCASAGDKRFANVNPGTEAEQAANALFVLHQAQVQLGGRKPGLRILCISEISSFRCPTDTTSLFAALPLQDSYLIERDRQKDGVVRIAVTEGEPGDVFWDLRFDQTQRPTLTMTRAIPAPF